jgi:hypothetical protein
MSTTPDPTGNPFPPPPGPVNCDVPTGIPNKSDLPDPDDMKDKDETE